MILKNNEYAILVVRVVCGRADWGLSEKFRHQSLYHHELSVFYLNTIKTPCFKHGVSTN